MANVEALIQEILGHLDTLVDDAIEEYMEDGTFKDDALDYAQTQGWSAPEDSEED